MKRKRSSWAKFKREDTIYLRERKRFAEEIGAGDLFDIADHFGLYSGIQTIGKSLAVYELIKQTLGVPGNIMEFGCWKGSNLLLMAKILRLLQPNTIKEVYGFDSFKGLRTFSRKDGAKTSAARGMYRGREDILRKCISLYEMDGWVHLVKGEASRTIKAFERENDHFPISLAYLDFDLYAPTRAALRFVHKRLSFGGLIAFDEAMTHDWKGEGAAMLEFLGKHEGQYETSIVQHSRQPTAVLRRVHVPCKD